MAHNDFTEMKFTAWYDAPTIRGIKPYIKHEDKLVPNPDYIEAQQKTREMNSDPVNHPKHYCSHPSGIECITITEKMNFNVGNAFKYLYRCDIKHNNFEDLCKASWYITRELERRNKFRIKGFREDPYFVPHFEGSPEIQKVLGYEFRCAGWMNQALSNLYAASVLKRSVETLEAAARCVANIIKIHETK